MSYLNTKIAENIVVPVRCETKRGTAFFVGPTQLLTARHVVKAHFQSVETPIYIVVADRQILCRAEELAIPDNAIDLALLSIVAEQDYEATEYLTLLCDEFVPNLPLRIYGYPEEVAMGMNLVNLEVKNRLKIDGGVWNDRALVRDDMLHLHQYDGLSGAPVISKSGRVVGIVVLQINETLSYLSIEKSQNHLERKGIVCDTDCANDDVTTLGPGRSYQQCEEAVATIHDRYMPRLHQQNKDLELILNCVTDKKAKDVSIRKAETLADSISKLPDRMKEKIKDDLKIWQNLDIDNLSANSYELLLRCYEYIQTFPFKHFNEHLNTLALNEYANQLDYDDFVRLKICEAKNLCLIGKAGSGKTHCLCEYSLKNHDKANIYLFFGTSFNLYETAINHIKEVVCQNLSFEDYNQGLRGKNRYAVVVIDALNEGLGCSYWNNHLGALRTELEHHDHFRLIVSVRMPFDKEVNDLAESSHWHVQYIDGFIDVEKAVNDYFMEYKIDRNYLRQKVEAFKNPLFLKIFCEAFHSMSADERLRVNKQLLYKRYVTKKNGQVSDLVNEDLELNIADKYLSKLAHYSAYYGHFNPIARDKARQYAKRMAPYRLWEQDLMHACLTANLLLEDRSNKGDSAVMFEYENLGDYYKAEELLKSKMNTSELLRWIDNERKFLEKNPEEPSEKFRAAVKALFDCWYHEGKDVSGERLIQKGGSLYELYYDSLMEADIAPPQLVKMLLKLDHDKVNPLKLIQKFEDVTLEETMKIHEKLKAYQTIGSRDLIWTRYVNQMYEMYGDDYIGEVPIEQDHTIEASDEEKLYLICITWMLSSSHPKFRALIIRKIRKILYIHQDLILWLAELFDGVNDPYVIGGLYCAICGVMLPSRDNILVSCVARHIFNRYYKCEESVPQDLIVRQWTLKIIERAYCLDKTCDCWEQIKIPFVVRPIDEDAIPNYYDVKEQRGYFGLQQGSIMMHNSIYSFEDFNRYIIGTNSRHSSSDFFRLTEDGKYQGVLLNDIMAEMAYYIMAVFGWNDKLGYLDNGKYSPDRSHNDQERIGKKFQWLAYYRVYARLMDTCRTSKEQYYYGDEANEEDLAEKPYPWNTSEISRFDPTLDVEHNMSPEAGLSGMEKLPIQGRDDDNWIKNNDYLPVFRCLAKHEDGSEYVMLMGYDTVKEDGKETFLFSNACFVRKEDECKFTSWANKQNFYGRWMPERRGMIEYLWNDYPWSDSYKSSFEHEAWLRPQDCPCDIMLSYEAQLQEDWEGIGKENAYHGTVYMPCEEIMNKMGLYCSEIRGVVKSERDDAVVALNTGHGNCINGLFIHRNVLNGYLSKTGYVMFYYVVGEKFLKLGEMNAIIKDLSAAYRYDKAGEVVEIQKMRVIDREEAEKPKNASDIIDDEDVTTPIADWLNFEKDATNKDSLDEENDNSFQRLLELSSQWNDELEDEDEA